MISNTIAPVTHRDVESSKLVQIFGPNSMTVNQARVRCLFDSVVRNDYESISDLFAANAREAIENYLSLARRWRLSKKEVRQGAEEKMEDYDEHVSRQPDRTPEEHDNACYDLILRELAYFLTEKGTNTSFELQPGQSLKRKKADISPETERLLRDAASVFADSHPPGNFVVYQDRTTEAFDRNEASRPPVFDGGVANATPPPMGATSFGTAGGAGTILHLACALDAPLSLAFLLASGADAGASHTAFRRLMIHEAACNGSVNCLQLLLELGQKFGEGDKDVNARLSPRTPRRGFDLAFHPRSIDALETSLQPPRFASDANFFSSLFPEERKETQGMGFVATLGLFRDLAARVKDGSLSELDAARRLVDKANFTKSSRNALAQYCSFGGGTSLPFLPRTYVRSVSESADGHGNTPLHWAAFKNEVDCVKLLIQYGADPKARAHPSGWTPLHDAAYSNSVDCIDLLVEAGAEVDARANSGATPLCFAAQEDSTEAVGMLLKHGANMTMRCSGGPFRTDGTPAPLLGSHSRFSGYTPLHYCAHYNAHDAAKVLLAHPQAKDTMEVCDLNDRLPIHIAAARGSAEVLRELLHAGARVETRLAADAAAGESTALAAPAPRSPRRPPSPEDPPSTPPRRRSPSTASVSSPVLRSMIPLQPVTSSKPWNCLTQRSIDECRELISEAEQEWTPSRHPLFTPTDRRAVLELLRVGKRLELDGSGVYTDLWPQVLSFCGRGWFDDDTAETADDSSLDAPSEEDNPRLAMPAL